MKLNKGEWSELFVGLLSLDRGELKLYKSPLEIKIKDISYDGEYFFNKQHIKNLDIKEFENSLNKGSGVFSLSPEIVKAIGFKKGSSKSKIDIMLKYLLQFRQDELQTKFPIIESIINAKRGVLSNKYFARTLSLKKISITVANSFLLTNHLMGPASGMTSLGLFCNSELVSVFTYRKYKTGIDVVRFANKLNVSVVGGLSKFLKYVERNEKYSFIQSYVDLRYGSGSSLNKLGFVCKKVTLGWKWTDGISTFNRRQCRSRMDERCLSEREHAKELGWFKIYDAGQALFIKNSPAF